MALFNSLKGKTLVISGASRGIGLAIAKRAAKDGANIAILAKTDTPHPKLPGTIHTAAQEIETAGGKALALKVDIRNEDEVASAIEQTVGHFGGIDVLVNNASAIHLAPLTQTPMSRYDLMHDINSRGSFMMARYCVPHLLKSKTPHILNISPPLDLAEPWFKDHIAYTMSKYAMSLTTLGLTSEFRGKIAVNSLWPRTIIATSAIEFVVGDELMRKSRKPEIMADAAHLILSKGLGFTGNFLIDDDVLTAHGVKDLSAYRVDPTKDLVGDFFIPLESVPPSSLKAIK